MSGIAILCVAPDKIAAIWPVVSGLLDAAYDADDEPMPDDLLQWLEAGRGLLWIAVRGDEIVTAIITSLVMLRSGLACRVGATGGVDPGWNDAVRSAIEDYARAEGCKKVYLDGRVGWQRVLGRSGYRVVRVSLEKLM